MSDTNLHFESSWLSSGGVEPARITNTNLTDSAEKRGGRSRLVEHLDTSSHPTTSLEPSTGYLITNEGHKRILLRNQRDHTHTHTLESLAVTTEG